MLCTITFKTDQTSLNPDEKSELTEEADSFVGRLRKYGHIEGGYATGWVGNELRFHVNQSRPDALDRGHYCEPVEGDYVRAVAAWGQEPEFRVVGDADSVVDWKKASSLFLFTHMFATGAAATCGDTGEPIPSYLLPIDVETRSEIYFWECEYKALDRIWVASGALEIEAYREVADPGSRLSVTGRDICAAIEKGTGKPTYYFLHRYYGRADDTARPCPGCGKPWHRDDVTPASPFHQFYYRCEPCRLVSTVCSSVEEGEEHAEIGEFVAE